MRKRGILRDFTQAGAGVAEFAERLESRLGQFDAASREFVYGNARRLLPGRRRTSHLDRLQTHR